MRNLRDIPIRRKLRIIIMLTSSVALLLASAGFITYEWVNFRDAMTRNLHTLAEVTGHNSAAALIFGDAKAAEQNLAALQAVPSIVAGCIFTPDRKLFASYRRGHETAAGLEKPISDGWYFADGHLMLFLPVVHQGEGLGTICLKSDMHEMWDRLLRYAGIVALLLVAALLTAWVLSKQLEGVVADPILHLVETTQAVSARNDYTLRADRQGGDELGVLVDSFNQMLTQIQQRDEALQRSNHELQDFAYVASHDLQEPLRKIQAFGDRLKTKCAAALTDDGRDYLERMQNAASRMQTLINDLLAFSRVTTKGQPFELVELSRVAREVLSDLEVRIEQTGARIEVADLPTLDADPMQMRQLLQNLIGNALKFRREHFKPLVKVSSRPVNGAHCELRVEDNGIGFDMKYLERIFGMFQRLHGREHYEGTGVGLAICRKIAERHGGQITAESAPGRGATFIVTLPVHHGNNGGQTHEPQ